jgi:hypothetical protein
VSAAIKRKLQQLDTATAFVRHVTVPLCESFFTEVDAAIVAGPPPAHDRECSGPDLFDIFSDTGSEMKTHQLGDNNRTDDTACPNNDGLFIDVETGAGYNVEHNSDSDESKIGNGNEDNPDSDNTNHACDSVTNNGDDEENNSATDSGGSGTSLRHGDETNPADNETGSDSDEANSSNDDSGDSGDDDDACSTDNHGMRSLFHKVLHLIDERIAKERHQIDVYEKFGRSSGCDVRGLVQFHRERLARLREFRHDVKLEHSTGHADLIAMQVRMVSEFG